MEIDQIKQPPSKGIKIGPIAQIYRYIRHPYFSGMFMGGAFIAAFELLINAIEPNLLPALQNAAVATALGVLGFATSMRLNRIFPRKTK